MNLSDLVVVVRASTRDFEAGMLKTRQEIAKTQSTAQRMNTVGGAMAGVGKKMALGITLPVVAAAAISVKMAANMETTMNQVQAASGATAQEMKVLGDYALKMGADTMFSAGEAAQAMLELSKGGMDVATIKAGGLAAALDLAAAGNLELGVAAETTVKAMGMFGLGADKAGSIAAALAGGANASTASVESLAQALSQVGPGAVNAGLTLQDTVGVLASFANKGIMGSDAGTSLKTMLTRLVPTTDKAAKTMKALGLSFVDEKGNIDDITVVAQKLKEKLGPLSQAQRTAAMSAIFGSDATRAATVLMGEGAAGIQKYIDAANNQSAAQDMAKARTKGLAGQFEQLKGSLETIGIIIGQILIPPLTDAVKWLTKVANKFMGLDKGTQKFILGAALIAAAIGPLLILFGKMAQGMSAVINVGKAFGKMPGGFSKFGAGLKKLLSGDLATGKMPLGKRIQESLTNAVGGLKTLGPKAVAGMRKALQATMSKASVGLKFVSGIASSTALLVKDTAATVANTAAKGAQAIATKLAAAAQWLWNAALTANPIGLIIVAIAALVAVFIILWKKCEWFRNFWKGLWRVIQPVLSAIWRGLKAAWDAVWDATMKVWGRIGPWVMKYLGALWIGLKTDFAIAKRIVEAAWHAVEAVTRAVWPIIVRVVRVAMVNVRIAVAVVKVVVAIVRAVWHGIVTVTRAVWKVIEWVVRRGVGNVVTAIHIVQKVIGVVRKAWNKVKSITDAIWGGIKRVVKGVIEWIWGKLTAIFDKLKGVYEKVKGWLGSDGNRVGKGGRGMASFRRGKHADGAYIPATTGGYDATLGEGGEGEWVVPASKALTFAEAIKGANGGGDVYNIPVSIKNLYGTDERAARQFAERVGRHIMGGVQRGMVGQNA